ncbi:MAG: hypothetical protein ABI400_09405, partial [Lacisediminihabitans sp.]
EEQAGRMQAALSPVLVIGPDFLAGQRDADDMAHTMVQAVQAFANAERARQENTSQLDADSAPVPPARPAQELQAALIEIYTCGSGYLADRCDSDCVVRTMTQIMGEFGDLAPAG